MNIRIKEHILTLIMVNFLIIPLPCLADVPGDVDNSGTVDLNDVILSLKVVTGSDVSVTSTIGSGVDGDTIVDLREAIFGLQQQVSDRPPGYVVLTDKGNANISGSGTGGHYWVDQGNQEATDSGPGSEDQPWKTFKHAVETAVAGDTINVMPGVYEGTEHLNTGGAWTSFFPANSGELGNPITYRSVVPGAAVLKSSSTDITVATRDKALAFWSRHDIIFDGFKTIGMVHFISSERVDFINGEVTVGSTPWDDPSLLCGIALERSSNCNIRNNRIHSMAYSVKNGSKYISHNQAGIMVYGGPSISANNLVEYNELDMNGNVYAGLGNKGGNLEGNVWRNNFIQNATSGMFSIGSTDDGIFTVQSSTYSQNIVINCKYGIEFDNRTNDAVINNNTLVNSSSSGLKFVSLTSSNITFVNNIVSKTKSVIYADGYTSEVDYFLDIFGHADHNQYEQYTGPFAYKESSPKLSLTFVEYQATGNDASGLLEDPGFINSDGTSPEDFKRHTYHVDGAGGVYPSVRGAFTTESDMVGNY